MRADQIRVICVSCGSTHPHAQHRDRSAVDTFERKTDRLVVATKPEYVEERKVVLGCRDREPGVSAEQLVIYELLDVAGEYECTRLRLESNGPVERIDGMAS